MANEAIEWGCAAVCVNSGNVELLRERCEKRISIASTIGFPLGACSTASKVREAEKALEDGAQEIDMVVNLGWLKSLEWDWVENDIKEVRKAVPGGLKVIVETGALTGDEKERVLEVVMGAGADYIKTCTGFYSGSNATLEDVKLFKRLSKGAIKIKASGGINDKDFAAELVEAGADRLGMSRSVVLL